MPWGCWAMASLGAMLRLDRSDGARRAVLCSIAIVVLWPASALPEASAAGEPNARFTNPEVESVVVTARRKREYAQDVPISLTAVSGALLEKNGIYNTLKLPELVPSLQALSYNPRNTNLIIRG